MNILTIDMEDWYHGIFNINSDIKSWHQYESRIEGSTIDTLSLLNKHNTKATFFILGYIAEKYPNLVLKLKNEGHEIATHGYYHQLVYNQKREEFYNDIRKAKTVIENIINEPVLGYRAPYFSITKKSLWALNILEELGFQYDSSVFPTKNNIYGIPKAHRYIHNVKENLTEYPPSCLRFLKTNIPVAGGFYLRIFPSWLIQKGIKRFNKEKQPFVLYFHTADLDTSQPKLKCSLFEKTIHYYNLDRMQSKLERILNEFEFTSIQNFKQWNLKK